MKKLQIYNPNDSMWDTDELTKTRKIGKKSKFELHFVLSNITEDNEYTHIKNPSSSSINTNGKIILEGKMNNNQFQAILESKDIKNDKERDIFELKILKFGIMNDEQLEKLFKEKYNEYLDKLNSNIGSTDIIIC